MLTMMTHVRGIQHVTSWALGLRVRVSLISCLYRYVCPDFSALYRCLTVDSPIVKEVQGFIVSEMTTGSNTL
jgi:hypothetical protein